MTATYTFDIFSSLDGLGSHDGSGGAYWGKRGPELEDHRLARGSLLRKCPDAVHEGAGRIPQYRSVSVNRRDLDDARRRSPGGGLGCWSSRRFDSHGS
jgi:hypothetical protein